MSIIPKILICNIAKVKVYVEVESSIHFPFLKGSPKRAYTKNHKTYYFIIYFSQIHVNLKTTNEGHKIFPVATTTDRDTI